MLMLPDATDESTEVRRNYQHVPRGPLFHQQCHSPSSWNTNRDFSWVLLDLFKKDTPIFNLSGMNVYSIDDTFVSGNETSSVIQIHFKQMEFDTNLVLCSAQYNTSPPLSSPINKYMHRTEVVSFIKYSIFLSKLNFQNINLHVRFMTACLHHFIHIFGHS